MKVSPSAPRFASSFRRRAGVILASSIASLLSVRSLPAATVYLDANGAAAGSGIVAGSTLNWDNSTIWNLFADGTGSALSWNAGDAAVFAAGADAAGQPYNVIVGASGQTLSGLTFKDGRLTLSGGALSFAGPVSLNAGAGANGTISNLIDGTAGLTKSGLGTVTLTNSGNTYTGPTTISAGALAITSNGALGLDPSPVVVTGNSTFGTGGGQLLLAGSYGSGLSLARNLSLSGGGTWGDGAALLSVGNNTIAGTVTTTGTGSHRLYSGLGTTTLSNSLTIASGVATYLGGNGNWNLTGSVTTPGAAGTLLIKTGTGTLVFAPSSASLGSPGEIQVEGGFLRISSGAPFVAGGTVLGPNGGTLEIRTDAGASFANAALTLRASSTVFTDHAVGTLWSAGAPNINNTVTFGVTQTANSLNAHTFIGRNGTNVTLSGDASGNIAVNPSGVTFTNSLFGGTLTFGASPGTGNITMVQANSQRVINFQGNGDSIINGNILVTGAGSSHGISKTGTGTLTLNGTASTYIANTAVTGTLSVGNLGAINKAATTGSVLLNSGTLLYTGAADSLAKSFNLLSTTGSNGILSSGTGALSISGNIGAGGVGAKMLYLGGSFTDADNTFGSLLIDNNVGGGTTGPTGLSKIGPGTWVLTAPSTAAYGSTSTVALSAATTATTVMTLSSGTTAGLQVGQVLAGVGTNNQITGILDATHFTIATGSTVTAGNFTVNAIPTTSTASAGGTWSGPLTVSGGTLRLSATSGTADIVQNSNPVVFATDGYAGNQFAGGTLSYVNNAGVAANETLGSLTATAGAGKVSVVANGQATSLTFASLGTRSTGAVLDFAPGTGTISFTSNTGLLAGAIVAGHATFNATDWATSTSSSAPFVLSAYTGYTTLSGASPTIADAATSDLRIDSTSSLDASLGATTVNANTLLINDAAARNVDVRQGTTAGTLRLGVLGGILVPSGTGATTIGLAGTPGTLSAGGSTTNTNGELVVHQYSANAMTINSAIVNNGATGVIALTKAGPGTLTLTGTNTYTGNTTINEGTLLLSGSSATLGTISVAANATAIRQNALLDLNGAGAVSAISGGPALPSIVTGLLNGAGTIQNSGNAAGTPSVLVIGNGTTTTGTAVFSGTIMDKGGVLNVTKAGATSSVQYLTGDNTYTGVTTLSSGTLRVFKLANIGLSSSIGTGTLANNAGSLVFNGGTLAYTGSDAVTQQAKQTPSVATDRLFTLTQSSGTIDSSGTYGNSVLASNANSAALVFSNPGAIAFTGSGNRTLTLQGNSTGDNEFKPLLQDPVTASGGTLTGTLALTKGTGAGLWILNPATSNTYTGTTTVSAGALQVPAEGSAVQGLPTGSLLTLSGGVLQTSGNFTRTLGALPGNVQLTSGTSGFSASSGKLTVTLGGGGLTWGGTTFNPSSLLLSSTTALSEVELTNAINLNAATRTVQVDDNTTTGTDFAILSGAISTASGTAGLIKSGTGTLVLTGANSYNGNTQISAGTLTVQTMDGAGGTSNLGTNAGALILGAANTTAVSLNYVGAGETTSRALQLNTTTAIITVDASGSGPLLLAGAVTAPGNGIKTLTLRGVNTDANEIKSAIPDSTGATSIQKSDSGTWILSGPSTFTGTTTVSGGALGIGASSTGAITSGPLGKGTLNINANAAIFAANGDQTVGNNVTFTSGTTAISPFFVGNYSLTLGTLGTSVIANTTGNTTITNNIVTGKTLTLGGTVGGGSVFNLQDSTNARTVTFAGSGATVINAAVQNGGTAAGALTLNASGSLTLNGSNTYTGATTVTAGALSLAGSMTGSSITLSTVNAVFNESTTGVIGGTGSTFTLTNGTASLAGANTFTGGVTLTNGVLNINGAGAGGTSSAIGTGKLTISGGIIDNTYASPVSLSTNNAVDLNTTLTFAGTNDLSFGTGTVSLTQPTTTVTLNGTKSLTFRGTATNTNAGTNIALNVNGAGRSLTLGGYAISNTSTAKNLTIGGSANVAITGPVTNGGTATGSTLAYNGSGVLTLSGTSTYNGATTITGGKVNVTGALGATAIAVNGGGALGGSGNGTTTGVIGTTTSATGGTVTVAGGATPATRGAINLVDSAIGTLTIQGNTSGGNFLTVGGTTGNFSSLSFETGTNSVDTIAVTNSGNMALNAGGAVVNLVPLAGQTLAPNTYNLITYGAGSTFAGGFTLGAIPVVPGMFTSYTLVNTPTAEQLVVGATVATATTAYWKGDQSATWNTVSAGSSNWYLDADATTNVAPPGTNTDVFFSVNTGAANLTNTLGQDFTINSLTFTSTASSVSIGGASTLNLLAGSGTGLTVQAGSAAHTITANVGLASSQTWQIDGTNVLTVSGNVSGGASTLTKSGPGRLIMSGTNSFTGGTIIKQGIVTVGSDAALGGAGAPLVIDGGTLQYTAAVAATVAAARPLQIGTGGATFDSSSATGGAFLTVGSSAATIGFNGQTGPRTVTLGGSLSGGATPGNVFAPKITDDPSGNPTTLIKNGSSNWSLNATGGSNFTGGTIINGGYLSFGVDNALLPTGNVTVNATTTGGSVGATNGAFNLTGHNQSIGVLAGNGQITSSAGNSSAIVSIGSGTFSGFFTSVGQSRVLGLTVTGTTGNGMLVLSGTNTHTGNNAVTGGTLQITNAKALGFGGPEGTGGMDTAVGTTTVSGAGTLDLNGNLTVNEPVILNGGNLINSNAGTNATLDNGIAGVILNNAGGYTASPTISFSGGGGTGATTTYASPGTNANLAMTAPGSGYTSTPTVIFTGGTGANGSQAGTAVLSSLLLTGLGNNIGGNGDLTVNAIIGGDAGFTKTGLGKLTLNAVNTYTGATVIQAGILELHGTLSGDLRVGADAIFDVSNLTNGTYRVGPGRSLSDSGSVDGSLEIEGAMDGNGSVTGDLAVLLGGRLAPGLPGVPGTLTANGANGLNMNAGSTFAAELAGPSSLSLSDLLVAQKVTLDQTGAGVTLDLALLNGYHPGLNGSLHFLISNLGLGAVTGIFANATMPGLFNGQPVNVFTATFGSDQQQFAISYDADILAGTFHGGNDIAVMAVPEPSISLTLLAGIGSLLAFQRRRRQR